jgi:hypothetical protein
MSTLSSVKKKMQSIDWTVGKVELEAVLTWGIFPLIA